MNSEPGEAQSSEARSCPSADLGPARADPYLPRAVMSLAALASILVYLSAFTQPMWLPSYYATPHLDTPKILGVTEDNLRRFEVTIGILSALYLAAFLASSRLRSRRSALGVLGLGAILNVSLLPMYPGGASDVFAYIAEADLVLRYHANPFTTPVGVFPDHAVLPFVDFPGETTHYGPGWLLIGVLLRLLSGPDLLASIIVFKAAAAVFLLGTAWLTYLTLLRLRPDAAVSGAVLVAWNPLLIFELAGNGHNDIAMMLLVALAFYLRARGSPRLAFSALLAAVLVKYVAVILLPLFLLALRRRSERHTVWLPRAFGYALAAGLCLGALAYLVGLQGTIGVLQRQSKWFTSSLEAIAYYRLLEVPIQPSEAASLVSQAARAVFGSIYLVVVLRLSMRPESLAERSFEAVLALMLVATSWFQPWYATWVVPLAAVASTRPSQAGALALTLGAFMLHPIMGFGLRLNWYEGNTIAINTAAVAATWLPTLAAIAVASLPVRPNWRPSR